MNPPSEERRSHISAKPFIVALLLTPFTSYWIAQMEMVRYTWLATLAPNANVIFTLLCLVGLNALAGKFAPRLALTGAELLLLYIMLSLVSAVSSWDIVGAVVPSMGHAVWLATPENGWGDLFVPHLASWLTVSDRDALKGYYLGGSSLYRLDHLHAWAAPVFWWVALLGTMSFTLLCINVLLRRRWTQEERLTYPVTILPLEMSGTAQGPLPAASSLFRDRLMWAGFAVSAFLSLVNGLHALFPFLPSMSVTRRFFQFDDVPWRYLGSDGVDPAQTTIAFYPFALGLGFLMPLEVLRSTTVFFAFYRLQVMFGALMGWRGIARFPYRDEQTFGAAVGLCLYMAWMGRGYFAAVWRAAFPRRDMRKWRSGRQENIPPSPQLPISPPLDEGEIMRYRTALLGALVGFALLCVMLHRAGMAWGIAPLFVLCYILLSISIARMRAEAGIYVHNMSWMAPQFMLTTAFGTHNLSPSTLTAMTLCFFDFGYRSHQMPHQIEALRLGEQVGMNPRWLLGAILLATLGGMVSAFWVNLHLYYQHGAATSYYNQWALGLGNRFFGALERWLKSPTAPDLPAIGGMGFGFFFVILVAVMRVRFIWFPFHPLGMVLAGNDEMEDLWLPIFLCWMLKWVVLRYGGFKLHQRAIVLALGVALGDLTTGAAWSLLNLLSGRRDLYQYYP